ncbi:MAG: hypothetical protein SWX82_02375 [Cyanobacteriota bacterium]|nr:hypothetical protein [Cyanobacteriota bacterium]
MKTIITILGISAILLSYTPTTRAQSNNPQIGETTLSGDSLKTVEGRSINKDNYSTYTDDPKSSSSPTNGIKSYELRRQQQKVEVIPGVSIPVNSDLPQSENPLENNLEGDKREEGFKLELGI